MNIPKSFASDNNSGVHPLVLKALADVNHGHYTGYGDDPFTEVAIQKFRQLLGKNIEVFFVYNGTGANTVLINTVTRSYNSIICPASSHINVDECGAPGAASGCKVEFVYTEDGKLTPELVNSMLLGIGFEHHSQPKVVSITQSTELGTLYSLEELRTLCDFCHDNNLLVHMDGARIANAAVALNCTFKEMTTDTGIDLLSFGGTKNGMMFGEAAIFFRPELAADFKYFRKQNMQLHSKMRYISAQFSALLTDELWYKNARHSNDMAQLLYKELQNVIGIKITRPCYVNSVFAILPEKVIPRLQQKYFFYVWDEHTNEVRFMTTFDTTEDDINNFVKALNEELGRQQSEPASLLRG
ncbi:MAG: low specificity L-threonine aldolase [Candidatus Cloacimonetes bacterium]|nr:low specificity L-threonine aldolase [Candidatus Cloacimonadota bacterium]